MNANPPDREDNEDDVDPQEIQAATDRIPEPAAPPEVSASTEELTEWDTPPHAGGTAVPKVAMEDEVSPAEQLIEEGLEEADRDQRMAAVDPDFEP